MSLVALMVLGFLSEQWENREAEEETASQPSPNTIQYRVVGSQGIVSFVVLEGRDTEEDAFKTVARAICEGKAVCQVMFWSVQKSPISHK